RHRRGPGRHPARLPGSRRRVRDGDRHSTVRPGRNMAARRGSPLHDRPRSTDHAAGLLRLPRQQRSSAATPAEVSHAERRMAERTLIGHNYTPLDLVAKVTGRARYAEDFRADGLLFCKLLLSPMPHARVRRVDASAALAMPGVRAILRAEDLPPQPPNVERA